MAIVTQTCSVWKEVSYDSRADSASTIAEVQANNRARNAFCK